MCITGFVYSYEPEQAPRDDPFIQRFLAGINRYREARWLDAAAEFRAAQESARNTLQWTEALYWVALTELAASDYGSALRDMEELEKKAPGSGRSADVVYHRARAYYHLGYYDEAIVLFKQYADRAGPGGESRKAAALYWIGECLYSMGQYDRAADFFAIIVKEYPGSVKYEAASYRLDLIKQKKIEVELLAMLKWSHEESLRTIEEYQRREKTYDEALSAYQKRLAETLGDGQPPPESKGDSGEAGDAEAAGTSPKYDDIVIEEGPPLPPEEIEALMERARQLRNAVQMDIDTLESGRGGSF